MITARITGFCLCNFFEYLFLKGQCCGTTWFDQINTLKHIMARAVKFGEANGPKFVLFSYMLIMGTTGASDFGVLG